jgi:hypothetical protein
MPGNLPQKLDILHHVLDEAAVFDVEEAQSEQVAAVVDGGALGGFGEGVVEGGEGEAW